MRVALVNGTGRAKGAPDSFDTDIEPVVSTRCGGGKVDLDRLVVARDVGVADKQYKTVC